MWKTKRRLKGEMKEQVVVAEWFTAGAVVVDRQRPYRDEYTGSLPNSEVNRRRARSVLNWGTVQEHRREPLALR